MRPAASHTRSRPETGRPGCATLGIMTERTKGLLAVLLGLLLALGGLAAYAVYRTNTAYSDHVRDNPTRRLARLVDGARAYYDSDWASATGDVLPKQFPQSVPLTPAMSPCEKGDIRYPTDPALWDHPTWRALHFAVDQPHPYRYEFVAGPKGFTARAHGDLDCDGVLSTFERIGTVDPDGDVVVQTFRMHEVE